MMDMAQLNHLKPLVRKYAPVPAGLLVLFVVALLVGQHLRPAPAAVPVVAAVQGSLAVAGAGEAPGATQGLTREQCIAEYVDNGFLHAVNNETNARTQSAAAWCRSQKLTATDKLAMAWATVNRTWMRHMP